ncbi:MAG TPA: endonuclease [Planctomycetota bacterium]|nr:endonuclease [Planctomycetota bacterium]
MSYHPLLAAPNTGVMGTVYMLHFDRPVRHARHYRGWASNLDGRLAHHAAGTGAKLTALAVRMGIGFQLAVSYPGDKNEERRFHNMGGATRLCPICKENSNADSG